MVFYYFGYSTWKGKMLYIEDIVVTERLRRNGIGKQLFDFMRRENSFALKKFCEFFEFSEVKIIIREK